MSLSPKRIDLTMKYFTLITMLALATTLSAQTKTLEIQGSGEIKVAPDQGILYLDLDAKAMDFGEAVNLLSKNEKLILKKLESLGYKAEKVKTTNFSVRENIIWRNGTRIDSGYIASQSMRLEFPNSKKNIGEFLDKFQAGKTDAQIRFGFTLSDELKASSKEKVLEKAVKDAKRNAELLAKFSEVELGGVSRIIYGTQTISTAPMYEMKAASFAMRDSASGSDGFQAEDITVEEQVTIHYIIK